MKQIDGRAAEISTVALRGRGWLVGALILTCCGGKAEGAGSGIAGNGNDASTAGEAFDGSQNLVVVPDGGGTSLATDAGATDTCDTAKLDRAILIGSLGGLGYCVSAPPPSPAEVLGLLRGAVVFDSEGRAIDNTGLPPASKQAWLDQLSAQRWSCLTGQTVGYRCSAAG